MLVIMVNFACCGQRVVVTFRAWVGCQLTTLVLGAGHRLKSRLVHTIQAILIDLLPREAAWDQRRGLQ